MEWTDEQKQEIKKMIADEKSKWEKEHLEPLQAQVKKLEQYKPKQKSEQEKEIEKKEAELFDKEVNLFLKENKLEDFKDFVGGKNMEEIKKNAEQLQEVLKAKKLDNSFKPTDRKIKDDTYSKAEKNGDTLGMIGSKLSKIFQ